MKIFNKIYLLAFAVMFLASCADEPLPFETFEEAEKGAFARLLNTDAGDFFFTDPNNSAFTFDVEFYGENNGADITKHEWFVRHRNNVTGATSAPALLISVPSSSFGTNSTSGLPSASYSFNMNDALAALGITLDDVNGGDDMIFDGFLTLANGSVFGPDNTGGSLQGNNGFDGIFRFVKALKCASSLDGTYDGSSTGTGGIWNCSTTWTGDVTLEQIGTSGEYAVIVKNAAGEDVVDMSMGAYFTCYGDDATLPSDASGELSILDACFKLGWTGQSRWGEVYTFNSVTVAGSALILDWENDYGESAETTLTTKDGSDWPPLK